MKAKVKDLQVGQQAMISGTIKKQGKKKDNGEPWIHLRITDNSGMAFAKIWNNLDLYSVINDMEDEDFVEAEVTCTKDGDYTHIEIQSIQKVIREEGVIVDAKALKDELRKAISDMQDEQLRKLVCAVIGRPDMLEAYFKAPATMMSGYSFEGGGVASVVRLIRLVKMVANVFNEWNHNVDHFVSKLNVDLLTAVAILEHVGNVRAYRFNGKRVEKTVEGELLNEAALTMEVLNEELAKIDFPQEQKLMLKHLIGSAHGRSDWGQLFTHRSREAYAFYMAWNLNLQMGHFEHLERNAEATDQFARLFQKTVFLGNFDE